MLTREEQYDLTLLITGSRVPMNGMEIHFLQVIHGEAKPCTNKEKEWAQFYTNNFSNANDNIRNNSDVNKYPYPKQKYNSQKHATGLQRIANNRRLGGTPAEIALESIINTMCGGKFKGRFQREWAYGGKWILDFFFHEVRLGIEVDGGYHNNIKQMFRDIKKELELERVQVTLLRLTNEDVLGDRNEFLLKFLTGWRTAIEAQSKHCKPKTKSKAIASTQLEGPRNSKAASSRKIKPFPGGWTSLSQGEKNMGDYFNKQYIDEGLPGSRSDHETMKKSQFSDMRKRSRGQ